MRRYYFIFLAIILSNCSSIKNNNLHLNDLISVNKLKLDIDFAYAKIQDLHPKLYWYISKKDLDYKFDSLKATITKPMTSFEFYKKLTPVICAVREGHMMLTPNLKKYSQKQINAISKKGVAPLSQFEYEIFNNKMYVVKNKSYDKTIKIGTEIIEINDKKITDLFNDYKNWFASDGYNKTFKKNRLARSFNMFYGFQNTSKDSVKYNFKYNDSLRTVTILRKVIDTAEANKKKRLAQKKMTAFDKAKNKAYKIKKEVFGYDIDKKIYNRNINFIEKDSSIAVLKINSFTKGNRYQTFYDETFSKIESLKTKTLIIDLRNNTGGRLSEIAYLYSFLSDSTFIFLEKAQVTKKTSLLHSEYFKGGSITSKIFKSVLAPFFYAFQYFRVYKASDGNFYYVSESSPKKIKKNAFKGKIYVLINGGCFSASSILSSNLKGSKRAFFVGEETGGAQNGTVAGQMPIIKIPNSKLNLKLGLSTCIPYYKTEIEGRGIFPDKEIIPTLVDRINDTDPEMNWILEDIKKIK